MRRESEGRREWEPEEEGREKEVRRRGKDGEEFKGEIDVNEERDGKERKIIMVRKEEERLVGREEGLERDVMDGIKGRKRKGVEVFFLISQCVSAPYFFFLHSSCCPGVLV